MHGYDNNIWEVISKEVEEVTNREKVFGKIV